VLPARVLVPHLERSAVKADFRWLVQLTKSKTRPDLVRDYQLLDIAVVLGHLVRNEVPIPVAISWLAPRSTGRVGKTLAGLESDIRLGGEVSEALERWSLEVGGPLAQELGQKLATSFARGTKVSETLDEVVTSYLAQLNAEVVSKAGSSETKMLIPTVFLILPVSVLFAVYPSLKMLLVAI
jgi:tight adherence protein C